MNLYPLDATWFRLFAGLLIGLALGSFVTALSYRAPCRISIIRPPSHCPQCQTPLTLRDLVPVLSWFFARGRCRHCKAPISARYPIIELITTLAVMAAFAIFGFTPNLIAALCGIVALITFATIRLEHK
jgi:prepilin signal peptidase PulO-like enzyme (type II secretory pathway)